MLMPPSALDLDIYVDVAFRVLDMTHGNSPMWRVRALGSSGNGLTTMVDRLCFRYRGDNDVMILFSLQMCEPP
jgi:hypothetical protein